ncbi:FHA domain-containing protein FhaB/FipA [Terrabacter sp. 2RAF25]|uniref:FHA domain-containing protein FhaB/FipA n=1 Tax=Terrabacter sp. 2RAF25 TaxID=3232998 RepID=UPI003F971C7C
MSELTLTLLRLGLLALLWIFIFSVVGVLRTDIYGTAVSRRGRRKARKEAEQQSRQRTPARTPAPAAAGAGAAPAPAPEPAGGSGWRGRGRAKGAATTLVVTEGPLTGTSLPLRSGGILIGRNPECALVLDDDYASGRHCRIYPDPSGRDGWVVEDLKSTNGTFIGRDRLTGTRPVEVGTSLRIGKTVLELRG